MSDIQTTPDPVNDEPQGIKDLRAAAARSTENAEKAAKAERELAFTKAGFDTDQPLVSTLMGTYTGDLTKDAVKAYMDSLNVGSLITPGETTAPSDEAKTPEQIRQEAIEAHQTQLRTGTIDQGGPAGDVPTPNPVDEGLKAFNDLIQNGGKGRADAATGFFDSVFGAAVKGDPRVIIPQGRQGGDE